MVMVMSVVVMVVVVYLSLMWSLFPPSWPDCKASCFKYLESQMPSLTSPERTEEVVDWFMEKMFLQSGRTRVPFPTGCF